MMEIKRAEEEREPLEATVQGVYDVRVEVDLGNGNNIVSDVLRRIARVDGTNVYFDVDTKYVTDKYGNTRLDDDGDPWEIFDDDVCFEEGEGGAKRRKYNLVKIEDIDDDDGNEVKKGQTYFIEREKLTDSEKVLVAAELYSKNKFSADEMEALLVHILGREEYESVKRRLADFLIKEGINPQGPGFKGKLEDKFNLLFRNKLGGGIALGLGGAAGAGIGALAILPTFGFPALLAAFNPFVLFGVLIAAGVLTIAGATTLIVDKILAERNKTAAFEVTAHPYGKDIAIKAIKKLEYYAEMKACNQEPNQEPSVININTTTIRDRIPKEGPSGGGGVIEQ